MSMKQFIAHRKEQCRKTEELERNVSRLERWKEKIKQVKRGDFSAVPLFFPEVLS